MKTQKNDQELTEELERVHQGVKRRGIMAQDIITETRMQTGIMQNIQNPTINETKAKASLPNPARLHGQLLATSAIYRYLLVAVAPIIFAVFIGVGFPKAVIQDQVSVLWVPQDSDYATDDRHRTAHGMGSQSTQFLMTGRPRDGTSNILTADSLLEHNARMQLVYATSITVDDVKYTLDDVCQNPAGPYVMPCLTVTVLDCFNEGESVMSVQGREAWRQQALATPGTVPTSGSAEYTGYLSVGVASSACLASGCNPLTIAAGVAPDATCGACIGAAIGTMNTTTQDATVLAVVTQGVSTMTPYTDKPKLWDGTTKLSDATVRAAVSAPCQRWDAGKVFGDIDKLHILGNQKKDADGSFASAGAFEAIIPMDNAAALQARVASAAASLSARGAAITITVERAEKVLRAMKVALEASGVQASVQKGLWDESAPVDASLVHTAFTDDSVVHGTFANVLLDNTTRSSTLVSCHAAVAAARGSSSCSRCSHCALGYVAAPYCWRRDAAAAAAAAVTAAAAAAAAAAATATAAAAARRRAPPPPLLLLRLVVVVSAIMRPPYCASVP